MSTLSEEPNTPVVLRGVILQEPLPESPFATSSTTRGGSLPATSPQGSFTSTISAGAPGGPPLPPLPLPLQPSLKRTSNSSATNNEDNANGAKSLNDDDDAALQQPSAPRQVSWDVTLSTVREYEVSETQASEDWDDNRWKCGGGCCSIQ